MKKIIVLFALIGFFINSCVVKNNGNIEKQIQNPHVTLIDVREADELINDGKIDKAVHIPKDEIKNHVEEIKKMPKPIVIFCRSGARAQVVTDFLKEKGIKKVYNGGGLQDIKTILGK
ncbi:MAG: rhodanese-like domain-containing protein [Flavobacteriales bacterium]